MFPSHGTFPTASYLEGGSSAVVGIASACIACWYTTHTMGRVGGFPHEKDPQHRAPQLSRQAPNQL